MDSTIIGVSKNIQRIRALIDQVADTGLNTVVNGETGVGKELVVQNLYQKSNRTGKPFVKVGEFTELINKGINIKNASILSVFSFD